MNYSLSQKAECLTTPVPLLIVFRLYSMTTVSENPPRFSWLAFKGVDNYIVKLRDSKGIVCEEQVKVNQEQTITYCSETTLKPGSDYIFTVEIASEKNYENYQFAQDDKIAKYVREGVKKINQEDFLDQPKVSLVAQLDSLLIARKEILDIIRRAILQGSNSEVICFLDDFIEQASAFKLLADACSSNDILDALSEISSQLAAANITLGKYLQLSNSQKLLAKSRFLNVGELTFSTQNLQTSGIKSSSILCELCQQKHDDYIQQGYHPIISWFLTCNTNEYKCRGCPVCEGFADR